MSHVIRIPSDLFSRLEHHAQGFDTPANVIERLLNHYEGTPEAPLISKSEGPHKKSRDKTKYYFNGKNYGKGRLVLAVVQEFASDHPGITHKELQRAFPKQLQGSIGIINKISFITNKYKGKSHKRHYLNDNEVIQLSDCEVAVCTEWGVGNIDNFIKQAEEHDYQISPVIS
jgi:hypothetical protein